MLADSVWIVSAPAPPRWTCAPEPITIEAASGWTGAVSGASPASDARQRSQPDASSASTVKRAAGNSAEPR